MTHITESPASAVRLAGLAAGAVAALRAGVSFLGRLVAAEIDRRQTMALLGADDHMLRDIGVSRSDVAAALLTPAGEKPSDRLTEIRCTHRVAERAQVREARSAAR